MTLKDDLTEIQGVGEKTAEKIIGVIESNTTDTDALEKALLFLERDKPRIAQDVLETALKAED
jgi:Holliday junction resolvasome RuvABC DNA-binding subunit